MRQGLLRPLAVLSAALALLAAADVASAQSTGSVQGTVVDSASARPVPGVQITVAGTTLGARTNDAGTYTIRNVPAGTVTLRAQRIGFAPTSRQVLVTAGGTANGNFTLNAMAAVLSEMVVVGYGTRSRAEVSNAVTQVSAEAIQNTPVAGLDAALQGKAPGVQVVQNAGNPGNGITVRIRGSSSISASNQPLYVIDGIPMIRENYSQIGFGGQDLTAVTGISPDEIESIDVLKDAAAAAIYGSRASNGVVLITTKRGVAGTTRFTFNTYTGTQRSLRNVELLNAKQYVEFMNEAAENDDYGPNALFEPGVDDVTNTDWQRVVQRTAPVSDATLAMSGGSDRIQYLMSGSWFDQQGIVIGSGYRRENARANIDFTATSRFSVKTSIGLVREHFDRVVGDNTIEGPGANSLAVQPNIPVRQPDGSYSTSDNNLEYANPLAIAELNVNPANTLRAIGGIEGAYDLTDRLRLNVRLGADAYNLRERSWDSPLAPDTYAAGARGVAISTTATATRYLSEGFVNFDPIRSATQRLALTGGASVEYNSDEYTRLRGEGFASNDLQYPGAAGKPTDYNAGATGHNLLSMFTRATYALNDRYFATASFRADGSSRFGPNRRIGYFPSASVGWTISEEPALAGLRRFATLKLRGSYGVTGNQGIGNNFAYLGYYSRANYAGEPGLSPGNFPNEDLRWESTHERDIGADLSFLGGRVSIIADYYQKKTSDLLVSRPITSTSGYTSVWDNVGNVENRGVELQLSTRNIESSSARGFNWTTDFNVAHNSNKVTALFRGEPFNTGLRSVNRVEVGQPMGAFHVIKFLRVDPATGDAVYDDTNGDGDINADDRQIVGSPHPEYYGGMRNNLSWMGFDLNTFLEFSQGGEVFNAIRIFSDDGGYYNDNKHAHVLKRWQQPGDITDVPRASWDGTSGARFVSSRFMEDASYVRLQELTLGYRLPAALSARAGMSDSRLYVSGRNLKLWTKYMGYDPDVNSNGSDANTSLGTDFYAYPRPRTITVGLSTSW